MLLRLLPEKVSEAWPVYRRMIAEALPPVVRYSHQGMTNILHAILVGRADVWAYHRDVDSPMSALLVTTTQTDPLSKQRTLLVYALYGLERLERKDIDSGTETLREHARFQNCSSIVAYTNIPALARYLEGRGWEAEYTLLELDI